jgi:hypothetical protein
MPIDNLFNILFLTCTYLNNNVCWVSEGESDSVTEEEIENQNSIQTRTQRYKHRR